MKHEEVFRGKTIVFGVTGCIAAYKAVDLVSRLKKLGAEIHVIMTRSATELVQPITFQTLSQNPVHTDMWVAPQKWNVEHIGLADAADLFMIVPATANIIGKVAGGIADDMLSTTVMAVQAPILLAPAMNAKMYDNPIVQGNLEKLKGLGYAVVEPEYGFLACGYEGRGRLPEADVIIEAAARLLAPPQDLAGKTVLVTAGPTREALDPVRHLSNPSTGKMGYAVAEEARDRGARVILITGPTMLKAPTGMEVIRVISARDMYAAVMDRFDGADIVIKSAAVSDYRPKEAAVQKMKKTDADMVIQLERNPDILYELGQKKGNKILVGFAAETNDLLENARVKIQKKNLDFVIANDVTKEGAGFASDTNIAKIINRDGIIEEIPKMTKKELACLVIDKVVELLP
jgi:phosphopantothenoylcysteine decarboxylase / phosphopantothenate---cysteine ligase